MSSNVFPYNLTSEWTFSKLIPHFPFSTMLINAGVTPISWAAFARRVPFAVESPSILFQLYSCLFLPFRHSFSCPPYYKLACFHKNSATQHSSRQ